MGSQGAKLGIDWLSITFTPEMGPVDPMEWRDDDADRPKNQFRDDVVFAVSMALNCDPGDWVDMETGMFGYHNAQLGPGGAKVLYGAPGRDDFHVSLPGQACGMISESQMRSWLRFALANKGQATRCDVNLDDYEKVVTPGEVLEALQGPDVVTQARQWLVQQGGAVRSKDTTGHTAYLGQKSSRQRLRVYDKDMESGGEIDAIRWELQARDEPARTLVAKLADGDWADVILRRLVAFVDFRDHLSSAKVELRDRLEWFQRLVGLAKRATAYLPKAPRTVEQTIGWIKSQVATSLAVAIHSWGGSLEPLVEIFKDGEKRWKPRHRAMLAGRGVS